MMTCRRCEKQADSFSLIPGESKRSGEHIPRRTVRDEARFGIQRISRAVLDYIYPGISDIKSNAERTIPVSAKGIPVYNYSW
jgi:hypothetical protein